MAFESFLVCPGNCISRMQSRPYVPVEFHLLASVPGVVALAPSPVGPLGVNVCDEIIPRSGRPDPPGKFGRSTQNSSLRGGFDAMSGR